MRSERSYPMPDAGRALKMVRRNLMAYRHHWMAFFTGFFEPVFYLLAVGFGVGQFVPDISYAGREIDYITFLAPGMLAASTLNGAIFDGFFGPFFKLNWMKTYDGIVTTPVNIPDIAVGEVMWALIRATVYAVSFLLVMLGFGLIESWWALLALPGVMLSGAALSAGAMVLTGLTKEITSLEKVMDLIVFPQFLFAGTFFPVSQYPELLQPVVHLIPLFHSSSLLRALTTGAVTPGILWHVAYLAVMFVVASAVAIRLMRRRLVA